MSGIGSIAGFVSGVGIGDRGRWTVSFEGGGVCSGAGVAGTFTGFIPKREKIAWFQRAAVHVQTSLKEGWGLSVIEANACGCPVVANDTTGLCDSVVAGETGLLYRYDDVADAAAKVRRVLMDENLCQRLTAAGLERAGEFSWDRNSEEMLALLKRTVEEHTNA